MRLILGSDMTTYFHKITQYRIEDQVWNQTHSYDYEQVQDQVRFQVRIQVRDQVRIRGWDQIRIRIFEQLK